MGATFLTNAKSLARRQRFRGTQVDAALKATARLWGQQVKTRAESLSRGTITTAQLRQYRPGLYSTLLAAQPLFDAKINSHTGLFAASWRLGVWTTRSGVTVTVWNQAPYAQFMQGTERMRRRGVLDAAAEPYSFSRMALRAKRTAESEGGGGSLLLELVQVGISVGAAYGGAVIDA